MNFGPLSAVSAAFLSVVGFVEGVDLIAPADRPLVDVMQVALSGDTIRYTRTVHSDTPIRAAWRGDVVNVQTEQSVPECESTGHATYGPGEPQTQIFDADDFLGRGCLDALIPGETYEIWASVSPLDGPASQVKSEAFTWE